MIDINSNSNGVAIFFTELDKYPFSIAESWTFVLNCCINSIEMTVWLWEIHENQTIIHFWYQIIQTIIIWHDWEFPHHWFYGVHMYIMYMHGQPKACVWVTHTHTHTEHTHACECRKGAIVAYYLIIITSEIYLLMYSSVMECFIFCVCSL